MSLAHSEVAFVEEAAELLEKANAGLEPELLTGADALKVLSEYARVQRLAAFGVAALARKLDNASEVAKATGTSLGKAKDTVATGKVLTDSDELSSALRQGEVSLDQATEIARAEESAPGSAAGLLDVAREQSFHVLREKARKVKLEAEQHRDLAARQHSSRSARSYSDELGMVHIHLALEPHVGTPIVARAEAEAARLAREARREGSREPFDRYLADAYAKALSDAGSIKGRAKRAELVVLVSHEVAKRGWKDVGADEVCKIPGVGPIAPEIAREIAQDAFINGVIYDGKDLREFKRWTRHIPVEVQVALELGEPPDFDGVACADCGNRFKTEFDHIEPRVARGPTSNGNLAPRCWTCHQAKTDLDRRTGKLKPPDP
jgi:hypothetical protein